MVEKVSRDFLQFSEDKDIKKLIRDGRLILTLRKTTLF